MNNSQKGKEHEALAASYLEQQGCTILQRNYRNHCGEIDLILKDHGVLVFAEVKYRRTEKNGYPGEAVDGKKQGRIRKAALLYLAGKNADIPCRFDVVSILGEEIMWIRDAF